MDSDIIHACKEMMAYLTNQKKMHINVPKDMEAASFYDSSFLKEYASMITTLEFDERALGMLACEKLINQMEKGGRHFTLHTFTRMEETE